MLFSAFNDSWRKHLESEHHVWIHQYPVITHASRTQLRMWHYCGRSPEWWDAVGAKEIWCKPLFDAPIERLRFRYNACICKCACGGECGGCPVRVRISTSTLFLFSRSAPALPVSYLFVCFVPSARNPSSSSRSLPIDRRVGEPSSLPALASSLQGRTTSHLCMERQHRMAALVQLRHIPNCQHYADFRSRLEQCDFNSARGISSSP